MRVIYATLYVGVLFLSIILLSKPYWYSRIPVGWDTPFYVGLTKLILSNGVQELIAETSYFHFYSLFSALVVGSGIIDAFSLEIILPLIMGMLSVVLFAYLTWKWYRDIELSLFALLVASTSFTVIRLVTDLHRNLLAIVFLLAVFSFLPDFVHGKSMWNRMLVFGLLFLMVITHVETYAFSLLVFLTFLAVLLFVRKSLTPKQAVLNFFLYVSPAFLMLFLLLPMVSVLWTNLQPKPLIIRVSLDTIKENLFAANLIPVIIFLVLLKIQEFKHIVFTFLRSEEHQTINTLLFCWTFLAYFFLLLPLLRIPVPPLRVLLISPVIIWIAIYFASLIRVIKKSKRSIYKSIHGLYKPLLVVTASIIVINVMFGNYFVDSYMRPFISSSTFESLRTLEKHNFQSRPIVILYFTAGEDTRELLKLYELWLNATIGDHLIYFGKLNFMIAKIPMPFADYYVNETSFQVWKDFENDAPKLHTTPVLIIPGDFYPSLSPYEQNSTDVISPGIFKLKNDYQFIPSSYSFRLVASRDFLLAGRNWYETEHKWASEGLVMEYSSSPSVNVSSIVFNFPIVLNGSYDIKIRIQDVEEKFEPIKVIVDDSYFNTVRYNGTMEIKTIEVFSGYLKEGLHRISLQTGFQGSRLVRLDYIDIVFQE